MEHVVAGPPGQQEDVRPVVSLPSETSKVSLPQQDSNLEESARKYSRIKLWIGIASTVLLFILTLVFVVSGLSKEVESYVRGFVSNDYVVLLLYVLVVGFAETVVFSPLSFYSGYYLEHQYHLSNQTFFRWVGEGLKGMAVSLPIGVPLLLLFYYCLKTFGTLWWLPVSTALFLLTVVLARLGPILIFPLFYKFVPLDDGPMKQRILALCERVGVKVEGLFTFNLSKNTKKANAAFTGIGRSKRILLGDTLVQNFTDEEVETVFAHELGHYKLKHVWSTMATGTVNSFLGLFLTAQCYAASLSWLGFDRPDQIAALPVLTLWLGLYSLVTSPIGNYFSRRNEYAADRYAILTTSNKEAFLNSLRKLARMNLAETTPPPIVEFLFHSHPSIDKRIRAVESLKV